LGLEPEVIILTQMARAEQAVRVWRRFSHMPAVRDDRIHIVPADLFSQPTPRSIEALEQLVTLLHPELTFSSAPRMREEPWELK